MASSVQMFPSTMKVDLMVTAFGLLAPEGQLIRTGGHMHHSRSAMALSGTCFTRMLYMKASFTTQNTFHSLFQQCQYEVHMASKLLE